MLAIPKLRPGSQFPSLAEPLRRPERGPAGLVQEGHVDAVGTCKVDFLAEALALVGVSKDR
jgi:hypothetical protein